MKTLVSFSLIAIMLLTFSFGVLAADSPEAGTKFDYTVEVSPEGSGTVKTEPAPNGAIKVISTPTSGNIFDKWGITGDYKIISGSLESKEIVIEPLDDGVKIIGFFKKDPKAPGTGVMDISVYVAAVLAVVCVAGALVVFKKALI
ncbi:MAG: hypothetical protein E7480_05405 [Ruminococcaceae bacterium]|nr:hypothetical protein [Oscillospiraceae bacterium]